VALVGDRPDASVRMQCGDPAAPQSAVTIRVTTLGAPVDGATVTLTGSRAAGHGQTDASGRVDLDVDMSALLPPTTAGHPTFAIGAIDVRADKPGYQSGNTRIWLIDCATKGNFVAITQKLRDQVQGQLSACASLSQDPRIRWPDLYQTPTLNDYGRTAATQVGYAVLDQAGDIGRAVQVLTLLGSMLETGSSQVAQLLGVERDSDAVQRLNQMWGAADRSAQELRRSIQQSVASTQGVRAWAMPTPPEPGGPTGQASGQPGPRRTPRPGR
jgi:hypothetical protein